MPNRGIDVEHKILMKLKARPHANSGAMKEKFDGDTREMVIEVKSTQAASYKLNRSLMQDLYYAAAPRSKIPTLILAWDDGDRYINIEDIQAVVPLKDLLELLNYEAYPTYSSDWRINI